MSRYQTLVRILDQIVHEGQTTRFDTRYATPPDATDRLNYVRGLAFIHLYLKVKYGIADFEEREHFITDGPYDGGVDGYFIDRDLRVVSFIQSKFRTTETNFEGKEIELEEILVMDIARMLDGEERDEAGNAYSGKIRQMVREIKTIEDIGRYKYRVILLANLSAVPSEKLNRLVGGFAVDVFGHERCYAELVFPVVTGTYFNAADLTIHVDLSNKAAGSKISYSVQTNYQESEITLLFVPTLEIGKLMSRYKNSVLKYNPRSFLEFAGQRVNAEIRNSLVSSKTNEFALLNNGITILSDETHINERIGQKNKAQLHLKNPQIINGGQTAYTLSHIFEDAQKANDFTSFDGKEVLVKIITLPVNDESNATQKLDLIERISTATNRQTAVSAADRRANDAPHLELQRALFTLFGYFYERKTGEFTDGKASGYISNSQIIGRDLFLRVFLASTGAVRRAAQKRLFARFDVRQILPLDEQALSSFNLGYLAYPNLKRVSDLSANSTRKFAVTKLYAFVRSKFSATQSGSISIEVAIEEFEGEWLNFIENVMKAREHSRRGQMDSHVATSTKAFTEAAWVRSSHFVDDVLAYFGPPTHPLGISDAELGAIDSKQKL